MVPLGSFHFVFKKQKPEWMENSTLLGSAGEGRTRDRPLPQDWRRVNTEQRLRTSALGAGRRGGKTGLAIGDSLEAQGDESEIKSYRSSPRGSHNAVHFATGSSTGFPH